MLILNRGKSCYGLKMLACIQLMGLFYQKRIYLKPKKKWVSSVKGLVRGWGGAQRGGLSRSPSFFSPVQTSYLLGFWDHNVLPGPIHQKCFLFWVIGSHNKINVNPLNLPQQISGPLGQGSDTEVLKKKINWDFSPEDFFSVYNLRNEMKSDLWV